ncbi:MAG: hypothetical protein KF812_08045 [Fimbriimonadaceae bacterium]|nr:hypothetical protein [Fimbriimonadaceae bacterium]
MSADLGHAAHSLPDGRVGLPGNLTRKINVTMMGAGSFFTSSILRDVILIPNHSGGELRLVDVDESRLALSRRLIEKILQETEQSQLWQVRASTSRRELLPDTDYLINSIEVSGLACVRPDNDIPLEYGVSQCIGDTIGPGGLFKAMRTVPEWLRILHDIEELAPQCRVLNYTNPMSIMCLAADRASALPHIGLCHSVQGTGRMLARYAGLPYEQMKWQCAGVNHLAWFTELRGPDGRDLYDVLMPMARDRASDFAIAEPVRSDMMIHFGAFITESSGHLSEYLPYYRTSQALRDKYTASGYRGEESFYANNWPTWRANQDERRRKIDAGEEAPDLTRSYEYGAWIIEAIEKNVPFVVHGNVPNTGCIPNLMDDGVVEVACLVDRNGWQPIHAGRLPKAMAAICDSQMRMYDLAADACLTGDRETAKRALYLDPLTAAVCCPAEISEMFDRMFEAEQDYLPDFR